MDPTGSIIAIANLIKAIYTSIGNHLIEKATLKTLLKIYENRLQTDVGFITRGLAPTHPNCHTYALDLYALHIEVGEWLAEKHIKLRNANGSLLTRRRWTFPFKFAGRKRESFQIFLGWINDASRELISCVQSHRVSSPLKADLHLEADSIIRSSQWQKLRR